MVLPSEYEAFLALCYVMHKFNWRAVYLNDTPKLSNLIKVLWKKIGEECSLIHKHLKKL